MRYGPSERLVALLLELGSARTGLTIADVQDRFEVSRRTAERLLEALHRLVELQEDVDWGDRRKRWRLERLPQALTTISEADLAAVQLAATKFRAEGLHGQAETLLELHAKLRASLPDAQARRLEPDLEAITEAEGFALRPGPRQSVDPAVFEALRYAVKARQKVRIDYLYRGSGRTGFDIVHPYGFLYGNRHYLVAYSENEKIRDVRMFLLANLSRVTPLDEGFVPTEGFTLRSYAERSFGVFQETPVAVAWRFSPAVAADAAVYLFHPTQKMTREPDGSLLVEFTAGGLLEMCWHLFTWGGEVEIVKPKRLRTMMRELLEAAGKTAGKTP